MRVFRLLFILAILFVVVGCQPLANATKELTVLKQFNQCRFVEPEIRLIENEAQLASLIIFPLGRAGGLDELRYYFKTYHVALIAMGQKPSTGYSIAVGSSTIDVKRGVAMLPVKFVQPSAKRMSASVITSPCIVFAVEKTGYDKIKVGETGLSLLM